MTERPDVVVQPVTVTFSPPIDAQRNGHPYRVLALTWLYGSYGSPNTAVLADKWGSIEYVSAAGLQLPVDPRWP